MILGQILNKANTLEELMLLLMRQKSEAGQSGSGDCEKIERLIELVESLHISVDGLGNKMDLLLQQMEQLEEKVNTIDMQLPDLKCRFPGGKPDSGKSTRTDKK